MPVKSTDYNTGLASTWGFSNNLSRLSSHTGFLGVVSSFSNYDVLGRAGTVATNGVSAANTYTAHSISSTISGGVTGSVAESRDALGRLTSSNTTWDGVTDNLTVTPDASPIGISRTQSLLGTHQASVRKDDGSVATAYGPTMPFGGNDGTGLDIEDGLVKTTATLLDSSHNPTGTFITTWTNAWGRVRKTSTPSTSGTGVDETLTEYALLDYSTGHQDPQRVRTTDAAGRKFITESDPYNELGMITRSGIDMNGNGSLASPDRYVQRVITASGGKLVTTLYLTENSGLREILRTEWDPSNNYTTVKINSNEETITREPNYSTKTVITSSSKGWSKTETFNALGLTETSKVSGTGIPTADLNPTWRADGSLASVSLTINGQSHSAGFNSNGTLATLNFPGRGNILAPNGHTVSGGVESMTVDGVTNTRRLDGTGHATSGGDVIGKSETLSLNGGGFKNTIHPAIGGNSTAMDTSISFNAAGAPTAKNYPDASGEIYTHYAGGLLHTVSLARGGSLEFGYSPDDCAKDLTSAVWPAVTSGDPVVFTIPGVAQSYGYDRAGRLETIGDSSGSRGITYQNGRLKQTTWTSGALSGYKVIRELDGSGRDTGFQLWRGNVLIHSASKTPNGVSGEISDITSGNLKVVIGRNAASQITGFQWGNATGNFTPAVTHTWVRGVGGRIEAAASDVTGAPSFTYLITGHPDSYSFDHGRRLKCATPGGEWTYAYTSGQLTSASHTTLGSFTYYVDGIGRRTNVGDDTKNDLLNRTLAWTNSQTKTLKVTAAPGTLVWVGINGGADTQITGFTGEASYSITPPGSTGGWVPWHTLAVLPGAGEGNPSDPHHNSHASPDAKAEQSGAVWVPPVAESFHYDNAGNRESSALWDYGWNAKNELVRARTKGFDTAAKGYDITFDYDAEGRRFSKKVTRYQNGGIVEKKLITFVWNGWDLLYEREQLPSGLTTLERKYVWGPDITGGSAGGAGGLLLIRETKGNATTDVYPIYDGTGHVVALTNNNSELLASYAYGPFGERLSATGPMADANPWRYATKYYDAETGLYYFGKRYLDPITGQWMSREILGEDESLNLYEYTHGDPVNNVDRLGLEAAAIDAVITNGIPTMIYEEWAGSGLAYLWNALAAGKVKHWGQSPNAGELARCFYQEDGVWHLRSEGARHNAGMDEATAAIPQEMTQIEPVITAMERGGSVIAGAPMVIAAVAAAGPAALAAASEGSLYLGARGATFLATNEAVLGRLAAGGTLAFLYGASRDQDTAAAALSSQSPMADIGVGLSGVRLFAQDAGAVSAAAWRWAKPGMGNALEAYLYKTGGLAYAVPPASRTTTAIADGTFYSTAFETQLSPTSYSGVTAYMHFKEANIALDAAMQTNPLLSDLGIIIPRSRTGTIIGEAPNGWAWHHDIEPGVLQLVPKSQHPNIPGGIFWETLHPNGKGGMSLWGGGYQH